MSQPIKEGYTTTEFCTHGLVLVGAVLTVVFHKDFSSDIPVVATAGAAISQAVYTVSRTLAKQHSAVAPAAPRSAPVRPVKAVARKSPARRQPKA